MLCVLRVTKTVAGTREPVPSVVRFGRYRSPVTQMLASAIGGAALGGGWKLFITVGYAPTTVGQIACVADVRGDDDPLQRLCLMTWPQALNTGPARPSASFLNWVTIGQRPFAG